MVFKAMKYTVAGVAGLGLLGGVMFGSDVGSYLSSSAISVREAVKENVPIEFELKRAKDMLETIIPEMHANIRMIAEEEIELEQLKVEVEDSDHRLAMQRKVIGKLRQKMTIQNASFVSTAQREQLTRDLSHRFELLKEAELVMLSKVNLMETREKALHAARGALENTQSRKRILEDRIEMLESKWKLVKAAGQEQGGVLLNDSKLARTERLINDIHKRLKVAERVMAHESRFVPELELEEGATIDETALLAEIDHHLSEDEVQPESKQLASSDTE